MHGLGHTSSARLRRVSRFSFLNAPRSVANARALGLVSKDKGGVVDPETLVVYGTTNVRVVDASIVPLLPGIHTEVGSTYLSLSSLFRAERILFSPY